MKFSNTIKTVLKTYQKYVKNSVWFGTGGMENHSSVTRWQELFQSLTYRSKFRRPLEWLLLRYTAENLQVSYVFLKRTIFGFAES